MDYHVRTIVIKVVFARNHFAEKLFDSIVIVMNVVSIPYPLRLPFGIFLTTFQCFPPSVDFVFILGVLFLQLDFPGYSWSSLAAEGQRQWFAGGRGAALFGVRAGL